MAWGCRSHREPPFPVTGGKGADAVALVMPPAEFELVKYVLARVPSGQWQEPDDGDEGE